MSEDLLAPLRRVAPWETTLRFLLTVPWCRPPDPDGAIARRYGPCPPPPPGHTLGVTVGGTALWELGPGIDETPLAPDARAAAARAARLAAREVGVADPAWVDRPTRLGARLVDCPGDVPPAIHGPSLGLPLLLAQVSLLLDRPVPVDLAATGALGADGAVLQVDGVEEKAAWIARLALAVRRVLVPPDTRAAVVPPGLELVRVATAAEAVRVVFPDLDAALERRWVEHPEEAELAARRIHRVATRSRLTAWGGVRRRAEALLAALPADSAAAAQARAAADIAHRHETVDGRRPVWPDDLRRLEPARPQRLRLVAHLVQAAADHDDDLARAFVESARPLVRPRQDRHPEDAMVLGAIGRALASTGALESASDALDDAIETFFELEEPTESSRALCERLRIAGLRGEPLDRLAAAANAVRAHPESDPTNDGFVRVALARAWVEVGEPERALVLLDRAAAGARRDGAGPAAEVRLDDLDWAELPAQVADSRLRWLARALAATGRAAAAREIRADVAREPWHTLAALDGALEAGGDGAVEVARLREVPGAGREVARVLARCPPGEAEGAFLSRHFRY